MSGSGGGGGYEYQAMATAYVAAHILSQERLRWIEHEGADIPISVAEETGGAGDDLCIILNRGIKIELQAKHGLQKDKLWEPLIKLGKGLIADPQMYGVILTDSTASKNIREDLRNDFKRLGQGRTDDLKAITKEAQVKLVEAGLPESDQDFFMRLVIIVLDLDKELQDGKHAELLLSHVLIDKKQSGIVWDCLCKEGLNLISHRGIRDLNAWRRLIGDRGIQIATVRTARNLEETCKELEDLCKEAFTNYKQLTTNGNSLMAAIGLAADLNSVIPLEIVERKQTSKSRDDIQSPEQGSSFYQATEKEEGERFATTDEFLEKVIRDRNTSKSKGLRLAVTGEAGAGKTTLLQTVGSYIDKNGLIPIWIPLQSLNKNIDAYLAEDCLRQITATLPTMDISIEYREALNELLKSGRVVLLLDGADEATDRNILQNLDGELQQNQLFKNTQVILSCRINAWDEGWRGSFDVYRIVPFTYPEQVENYIDRFSWGEEEILGISLKDILRDEKNSRLRDMVANPLRLALLCYIWKDGEESLPDTRAALYKLMLKAFYKQKENELKNREFGKPSKELEEALGKLALKPLHRDDYRYLILESDIEEILGDLDNESGFFWQATKKFGLLNHVGKSSKRCTENVYAFWHPTFQEYFAAFHISRKEDYEFFLQSHIIFKTQWSEVISIWLEMEEVDTSQKQQLSNNLLHFEECGGFYQEEANKLCRVLSINISEKSMIIPAGQSITLNLDFCRMRRPDVCFIEDTNPVLKFLYEFDGEFNWDDFEVNSNDARKINRILNELSKSESQEFHLISIQELARISEANEFEIEEINSMELIYISEIDNSRVITYIAIHIFWNLITNRNNHKTNKFFVQDLIYLIKTKTSNLLNCCLTRKLSAHLLTRFLIDDIPTKEIAKLIVSELGLYTTQESYANDNILYKWSHEVVSRCIRVLTYEECHKAWHSQTHSILME